MLFLIHNSTSSLISADIQSIKDNFRQKIDFSSELYSLDSSSFDEITQCLSSPPLFSELKMVLVDNVHSLSKEQVKRLIEILPLADRAAVILYTEGKADKILTEAVRKSGKIIEHAKTSPGNIHSFIEEQFQAAGKKLSRQAAVHIAQKLGNDFGLIKNEIKKLIIFSDKEMVNIEDIQPVIAENPSAQIFELIDAVAERNSGRAMQRLGPVATTMEPGYVFNMLKRHYRLIARSKSLGAEQIATKLRVHPFVARKISIQAKGYSITTMRKAFQILLTAERESKTGKDKLFSLQKAIIELAGLK